MAPLRQVRLSKIKPRIDVQPRVLARSEEFGKVGMNFDLPPEKLIVESEPLNEVPPVPRCSPAFIALDDDLDARCMQQAQRGVQLLVVLVPCGAAQRFQEAVYVEVCRRARGP
jgi:hypothetical protein